MFVLIAPDSKSSVNGSETMVVSPGFGPGKVGPRGGRAGAGAFVAGGVCAKAAFDKAMQAAAVIGRKYNFGFMRELKFGRGSKARKIILPSQGFRRLAKLAQFSQTQSVVTLGEPFAFVVQHQRAMKKLRRRQTQRAIN